MVDNHSQVSSDSSGELEIGNDDNNSTKAAGASSKPKAVPKEAQAVCVSKALVYFVLTLAALAVSATTFMLTFQGEEEDFEKDFRAHANEILTAAEENIRAKENMIKALSVSFASTVKIQNQTWPYVTVPDWEKQTAIARENSGATFIGFCPVIAQADKEQWEIFSVANQQWVYEGLAVQGRTPVSDAAGITPVIYPTYQVDDEYTFPGWYLPVWQQGPAPDDPSIVNIDSLTFGSVLDMAAMTLVDRQPRLSDIVQLAPFLRSSYSWYEQENKAQHQNGLARDLKEYEKYKDRLWMVESEDDLTVFDLIPHSFLLQPVFQTLEENAPVGGFLFVIFPWLEYFQGILRDDVGGFLVHLNDHCNAEMTLTLDGSQARLYGYEDAHDREYDYLAVTSNLASLAGLSDATTESSTTDYCYVTLTVYPTRELHDSYKTNDPYIFALVCLLIFVCTALIFALYDYYVQLRERLVERKAARTQALVSSLFPEVVQERILDEANKGKEDTTTRQRRRLFRGAQTDKMMDFLNKDQDAIGEVLKSKPIADLFPNTTILFADIVGFTAWSSSRAPEQVFVLLETLYHNYDLIAKKRGVFKVETIGDCYVAVTGLPEPRSDHAVAMCKFARDCLAKMHLLIKDLEVELGPDTSALGMRFGLHSGAVTAGVLRGDRARFQLFGDTMNTASRMESNGVRNRIQVSEQTAEELRLAGKADWLVPREEKIYAKGKGHLQVYFVEIPTGSDKNSMTNSTVSNSTHEGVGRNIRFCPLTGDLLPPDLENQADFISQNELDRLVDFDVSILKKPLARLAAIRPDSGKWHSEEVRYLEQQFQERSGSIVDEAQDVIDFPKEDVDYRVAEVNEDSLHSNIQDQLRLFVRAVAACYKQRPLHNFRFASSSIMSAAQMLLRLEGRSEDATDSSVDLATVFQNPLVAFALLFAALIGNADHPGLKAADFMIEQPSMLAMYKSQSLIQQNAFDIAWAVFMDDAYRELRGAIYTTREEFKCFRQTVIKCVLAMNIASDVSAMEHFETSWDKVFTGGTVAADRQERDARATVVLECIAAQINVFYSYQHRDVFSKWTERALEEAMEAYASKRSRGCNPLECFHESHASFLQQICLPLVKRLKHTGTAMSPCFAQLVDYAETNLKDWVEKGRETFEEMKKVYVPPVQKPR